MREKIFKFRHYLLKIEETDLQGRRYHESFPISTDQVFESETAFFNWLQSQARDWLKDMRGIDQPVWSGTHFLNKDGTKARVLAWLEISIHEAAVFNRQNDMIPMVA